MNKKELDKLKHNKDMMDYFPKKGIYGFTARELNQHIDKSLRTIRDNLKELKEKGELNSEKFLIDGNRANVFFRPTKENIEYFGGNDE